MKRDAAFVADVRATAGPVTFDCGCFRPDQQRLRGRRDHYDNSCSVFASVRIGENDTGCGSPAHHAGGDGSADRTGGMCQPSGDWQPHRSSREEEFIAAYWCRCRVPEPSGDNGGSAPGRR